MRSFAPLHLETADSDVTVSIHPRGSEGHATAEAYLLESGIPIPLPHRTAWTAVRPDLSSVAYVLRHRWTKHPLGVFCGDLWPSRMFPGHYVLRVERFGNTGTAEALRASVGALVTSQRRLPRILRLRVEVSIVDSWRLGLVDSVLEAGGFTRQRHPRNYEATGFVDVTPPEDDVFASFHRTCRRHIRSVAKKSAEVRPVLDEPWASRIEELRTESYARSGGTPESWDWPAIIRFSRRHPDLSRIAGLFRTDLPPGTPESLLAFAWAVHHGDHTEFVAGGATRATTMKIPLAYGIQWDLIRWAKAGGAALYDMGGISTGTTGSGDPLGGISDFKRYFNPRVQVVGREYTKEGSLIMGRVSGLFGRALELLPRR